MKSTTWKPVFEPVVALMVCTLALVSAAHAEPVTIDFPYHFRSQRSLNTVGYGVGDRLVLGAGEVDPVTSTTMTATQGGVTQPLFWVGPGLYPKEFAASIPYDPNLTGAWVLTAVNGPDSATATTRVVGDIASIPFVRNAQLIGTGLTPKISWEMPPGTAADRVVIQVMDDVTNLRMFESPSLPLTTTSFTVPDGWLVPNHPYVIRIKLEATEGGALTGPPSIILSRSESYINFTPLEGGGPGTVFLPYVGQDPDPTDAFGAPYVFDFDVIDGVPVFIDPIVAVGYDYAVGAQDSVRFASVTLPKAGDNLYDLYVFDGSTLQLAKKNLKAGETFHFGPQGAAFFRVLGIEGIAGLDPNNVTAFVTELTFAGTGKFTGTMTPIVASVPEASMGQVCSRLGRDGKTFIPDLDVFEFDGAAGEEAAITLEVNPDGENNGGERTTLTLKDKIRGVWLLKQDRSVLPNQIVATLPGTGEYLIIVSEQPWFLRGTSLRGDYCLTLKSIGAAGATLRPTSWVEP